MRIIAVLLVYSFFPFFLPAIFIIHHIKDHFSAPVVMVAFAILMLFSYLFWEYTAHLTGVNNYKRVGYKTANGSLLAALKSIKNINLYPIIFFLPLGLYIFFLT